MSLPSLGRDARFGISPRAGGDTEQLVLVALPLLQDTFFSAFPSLQDHVPSERRKRHDSTHAWDPSLIKPLQLSITLSPYTSIASPLFLRSLRDSEVASYWLSLQPRFGGCSVRDPPTTLNVLLNLKSKLKLNKYLQRGGQPDPPVLGANPTGAKQCLGEQLFSCFIRKQLSNFHFQKILLKVASIQKIPPVPFFAVTLMICQFAINSGIFWRG